MIFSQLYLLLGAVVVIGLLALWARQNRPVLASNAPPAPSMARRAEALILGVIAAVILIIGSTDYHNNGMMSRLSELPISLACLHVGLFLAAILFSAVAVKFASLGFTRAGIIVLTCTLIIYGLFINGPGRPINAIPVGSEGEPDAKLAIDVSGVNIPEGIDLWVNGTYLGKTPVQTTLAAFLEKVPDVPESADQESDLYAYANRDPLDSGKTRIAVSTRLFESLNVGDHPELARLAKPLYATVEYAGERGLGSRGSGWGRSGSGIATSRITAHFDVTLPARRHRLEELLNLARLNDYHVNQGWFQVMDGYGIDGWLMLRHLVETTDVLDFEGDVQYNGGRLPEPEFLDILRQWATWKYDLDDVHDSKSAWSAFMRVIDAADANGSYLSEGVEGVAVATLTPHLDPETVIDRAVDMLDVYGTYSILHWRANGQPAFGIVTRPRTVTVQLGSQSGAMSSYGGTGRNPEQFPPSAAAVAHALWLIDRGMDAEGPEPNPVESTIAPKLLQRAYGSSASPYPLMLATEIGGRVVEDYLLRHDWQASVEQNRQRNFGEDGMHLFGVGGSTVNKWCYSLAQLDEPNARKVRVQSKHVFLDLARYLVQSGHGSDPEPLLDRLDYLFHDLEDGEESLAMQFWPELLDSVTTGGPWTTGILFPYLVRMEPLPTIEMYVDAWDLALEGEDAVRFAVSRLLKLPALPEEKRTQILAAIAGPEPEEFDEDYFLIKQALFPGARWTQEVLYVLHNPQDRDFSASVARWLEHTASSHELVGILAEDPDPGIRTLVLGALRSCPTSANRRILAKLLEDPDSAVQEGAIQVQKELQELAATPPGTFASNATTFSATEAGRYLTSKLGDKQE